MAHSTQHTAHSTHTNPTPHLHPKQDNPYACILPAANDHTVITILHAGASITSSKPRHHPPSNHPAPIPLPNPARKQQTTTQNTLSAAYATFAKFQPTHVDQLLNPSKQKSATCGKFKRQKKNAPGRDVYTRRFLPTVTRWDQRGNNK